MNPLARLLSVPGLPRTCGQDGRHDAPASGGSCPCGLVTRMPRRDAR